MAYKTSLNLSLFIEVPVPIQIVSDLIGIDFSSFYDFAIGI
jgi:hypothetical protein